VSTGVLLKGIVNMQNMGSIIFVLTALIIMRAVPAYVQEPAYKRIRRRSYNLLEAMKDGFRP
jgi:hypothetical protein